MLPTDPETILGSNATAMGLVILKEEDLSPSEDEAEHDSSGSIRADALQDTFDISLLCYLLCVEV